MHRREVPSFGGGIHTDLAPLAASALDSDPRFVQINRVRLAARTAHEKADASARLERVQKYKSRGTRGPFQPGETVMVYRTRMLGKSRAPTGDLQPKHGFTDQVWF